MSGNRLAEIESALSKLESFEDELSALKRRAGNFRPREVQRVASGLGYELRPQRTSEPVWQHADGWTVAIPNHSTDLGKGLAVRIIKTLLGQIANMKQPLEAEAHKLKSEYTERRRDYNDYGF